MSVFFQIEPLQGVDESPGGGSNPFMMVPEGGFNLITHTLGKSAHFTPNVSDVFVLDLTDSVVNNKLGDAAKDLVKKLKRSSSVQDVTDMLNNARKKVPGIGKEKRLLAVVGRTPKEATIKAESGKTVASLDVRVASELNRTVSFLFFRYAGEDLYDRRRASYGTSHAPEDSESLLAAINAIYKPQANISFSLNKNEFFDAAHILGKPIKKSQNSLFTDAIDRKADWTVCFVEQYDDGIGFHAFIGKPGERQRACVISDSISGEVKVSSITEPKDVFVMVIAHELAHGLGAAHSSRDGVLGALPYQGILIDKNLLKTINPRDGVG